MEFNLLNNFGRTSPKKHPCKVSSRLAQWFRRRRCLKEIVDDFVLRWAKQEGHDGPGSLTWVIFPTIEFYIFVPLVPTCDPQGGASFDSKGITWIRLIKVHKAMLNTKYQSSNPFSIRGEEFWSWFSLFLCSNLWPPGRGQFWPHEHHINKLGRGPQGDAKHQISKLYAFQFRGEEFWRWDSLFLCSNLWPPGVGPILTSEASSKQTW